MQLIQLIVTILIPLAVTSQFLHRHDLINYEAKIYKVNLENGKWSGEIEKLGSQEIVDAILSDITSPIFFPKGRRNIVFNVNAEVHYKDLKFAEFYIKNNPLVSLQHFVESQSEAAFSIEVLSENLIDDDDMRTLMKLGRNERFNIFNSDHTDMAATLIHVLSRNESIEVFTSKAVFLRDRINLELFVYGFSMAVLMNIRLPGVILPKIVDTFPRKFFDKTTYNDLQHQAMNQYQAQVQDPIEIEIPMQYTATDREPEQKLAYFREDIEVNMHHWHWHLIFPFGGAEYWFVNKDRRGELFYYMHQQMMARYGFERLSNRMPLVKSLNVADIIPEGYYPKLDGPTGGESWAGRSAGSSLKDLHIVSQVSGSVTRVSVLDLQRWTDRVLDAIKQGQVKSANGSMIDIMNEEGIDILGNIVEASILSVNPEYYGNLHNQGHNMISQVHDPDGRFMEPAGVMSDVTTAMRDPIFFKWHTFINYVFDQHKQALPKYTYDELSFSDISVNSILVDTQGSINVFHTFWEKVSVPLDLDMSFQHKLNITAKLTRLQHHPFTYNISLNNVKDSEDDIAVRIFLLPSYGEHGELFPINEQRIFAIEMDRFTVRVKPGKQIVTRESKLSSVTQPDTYFNDPDNDMHNNCGCGWPQHMLVPKGSTAGMEAKLFVVITDWNNENPSDKRRHSYERFREESRRSRRFHRYQYNAKCSSSSFCGNYGEVYPTRLPMGFPFDRSIKGPKINFLEDFSKLYSNMKTQTVNIKFTEKPWDPSGVCSEEKLQTSTKRFDLKISKDFFTNSTIDSKAVIKKSTLEEISDYIKKDQVANCMTAKAKAHTQIGSNYYFISDTKVSWNDARQKCKSLGLDLISLETSQESERLIQYIKSKRGNDWAFWTGGTDVENEGQFKWIASGKPLTFTNWFNNEPNNAFGSENCIVMYGYEASVTTAQCSPHPCPGRWNDDNCLTKWWFICELQDSCK